MNLPIYKSNDELPLTMNAKDIAGYRIFLNLCLSSYEFKKFSCHSCGKKNARYKRKVSELD